MFFLIGHIDDKIITIEKDVAEDFDTTTINLDAYPANTVFGVYQIDFDTPLSDTDEYYITDMDVIAIRTKVPDISHDILNNSVIDKMISDVELAFARLVDEVLIASASLNGVDNRRVSSYGNNAQFKIYNLFQSSVGLGILPSLSVGAVTSITIALKYLKLLSMVMDDITLEIKTTSALSDKAIKFMNMNIDKQSFSDVNFVDTCTLLNIDATTIII